MADAPAERGTARPPATHEDTVAIQFPVPPAPTKDARSNGQAKVLPPMPVKPTKAPPASPGPKPASPPPQASAPAAAAAATAAVVTPAPAPAATPVQPKVEPSVKTPRPEKTPKPAKPAKPVKAAKPKETRQPGRRARLRMTRIDPWSVMKTSFLLSIALGIVTVVSVFMVWSVLDAADVWTSINQAVQGVVGGQESSNFDIEDYIGTRRVLGFTMIVAAVDVVLLTAIATLGAFLYNMSASLLGGIEVTLAEDN